VDAEKYYGSGYQDVALRVPAIQRAEKLLGWQPKVDLESGLRKTLDFYLN
jgi:nucleoside-diphosphate-sugar epimerase